MRQSRFFAACAALVMCTLSPASFAADRAIANVIGYSSDGRYFSFEEFGIQDGSGFAFSTFYLIDLREDRWIVGTPIHVVAESEKQSLTSVRRDAAELVAPRLNDLGIDTPAQLVAAIGDGVPDTDGHSLTFGLPTFSQPGEVSGANTLTLETFVAGSGSPCQDWFGEQAIGYKLTMQDNGPARMVHQDSVLPRSRGCPAEYRIFAVYAPFEATDISRAVALISVFSHGFEGLDRRFVALPLAYPQGGF